MEIFDSKRTFIVLTCVIAGLVILNCVAIYLMSLGLNNALGFIPKFYFDAEKNIPTYFSGILLFMAAQLLFLITRKKYILEDKFKNKWLILGIIFLFLSADEMTSIHELAGAWLIIFLEDVIDIWRLGSPWVIVYLPLVAVFGISYLRFIFKGVEFNDTRNLIILSAVLFVGSAIGFEILAAPYANMADKLVYHVIMTLEELFEMLGISIFIAALMNYLKRVSDVRLIV